MNKDRQKFLKELKTYGIQNNIPNITEKNAEFLHFLVKIKNASSILEIGTANGYSTIWLADAIEHQPYPRYLGIDISEPTFEEAKRNIKKENLDHFVELQLGNALDILPNLTEKFDIIFLDAQKALYTKFWDLIKPLMNPNTLVIVDDILKFPKKTKSFHETMKAEKNYESVIIPTDEDDGIMLIQPK